MTGVQFLDLAAQIVGWWALASLALTGFFALSNWRRDARRDGTEARR